MKLKNAILLLVISSNWAYATPQTPIVHPKTNSQTTAPHPSASEAPTSPTPADAAKPVAPEETIAKKVKAGPLLIMMDGNSKNKLDFEYDKNGIPTHLLYETQNGQSKDVAKFSMKQLESADGAVLGEEFGVVGLAVRAKLNQKTGRGKITFTFVNDGSNMFSLKHRECSGTLLRSPETGRWEIFKPDSKNQVKSVEMVQWSLGLTTLKGLCPAKFDKNDKPSEDLTHSPAEDPAFR